MEGIPEEDIKEHEKQKMGGKGELQVFLNLPMPRLFSS